MNIQKALDLADSMKPNMMAKHVKIAFLQELDQKIYKEILLKHKHEEEEENMPEYGDGDEGKDLLVPAPYDILYMYWLMSKIDLLNQEIDKYNNDRALFENAYEEMSDWWTREHMPLTAMPFVRF